MFTTLDTPQGYRPSARRLAELVHRVEDWSQQSGWETHIWEVSLECPLVGTFQALALRLSIGSQQILLEPVARACPGTEGVVDLYLMPGRDDIGSLYLYDDEWHLQYIPLQSNAPHSRRIRDAVPLDPAVWQEVLREAR